MPTRLKFIGALILLVGLVSAAWIYHGAVNAPYGASGYEEGSAIPYSMAQENTKQYRHDLEVYGGKANVMMDEFMRWFMGLWQGKSLAKIIGFFSIVIALGFFYEARHRMPLKKSAGPGENHRDGPG